MKKADAAAAAELRLAKVAWVPETFTDREIPAASSWESRDDHEDEDGSEGTETRSPPWRRSPQPSDPGLALSPALALATVMQNQTDWKIGMRMMPTSVCHSWHRCLLRLRATRSGSFPP
jgi:hypothetical protein